MQGGLTSRHVILTRPAGRNGRVPQLLRDLGHEVTELPALELYPVAAPNPVPQPSDYDLIVFVSRYAVQRYIDLLAADPSHQTQAAALQWPAHTLAATVGAASAKALRQAGFIPEHCIVHPPATSTEQDSEALLALLEARGVPLDRVLVVRGTQGREWLGQTLAARGARVDFLPVYERRPAAWSAGQVAALRSALARPEQCVFLLTSSEGVHALAARMVELGLSAQWSCAAFIVIHERIAATLQSVLDSPSGPVGRRISSCAPDDDAIVQMIHAMAKTTDPPIGLQSGHD